MVQLMAAAHHPHPWCCGHYGIAEALCSPASLPLVKSQFSLSGMAQSSSGGSVSPCWWYGSCLLCMLPWSMVPRTALAPYSQPWGSAANSHPSHTQHLRQYGHPLPQYLNLFLWRLQFCAPKMPLRAQQMCSEPESPHRTLQPLPGHVCA